MRVSYKGDLYFYCDCGNFLGYFYIKKNHCHSAFSGFPRFCEKCGKSVDYKLIKSKVKKFVKNPEFELQEFNEV